MLIFRTNPLKISRDKMNRDIEELFLWIMEICSFPMEEKDFDTLVESFLLDEYMGKYTNLPRKKQDKIFNEYKEKVLDKIRHS